MSEGKQVVAREPMRVLHVLGNLNVGGAETFIMNVYRHIDRSKVQFDFMVHAQDKGAYEKEAEFLGAKIYRMPAYNAINHVQYKRAWQNFFDNNREHEIIHGHMTSTAAIYLKIANKYGKTTIAHSHSTSSGDGLTAILKEHLQKQLPSTAAHLWACSEAAGVWCYSEENCRGSKYKVIKNAIDIEQFAFDETRRDAKRKELEIENKFVVGHVGRFFAPKNHNFLVDIFANIYSKNNNAVLLLVGDGNLRSQIEQKVEKLGLANNVRFTGVRDDVAELLCAMDVFAFPSLWEGLPVTLIEAQANGLKCFVSDEITKEVNITDFIENLSLHETAEHWADKITACTCDYERKNMSDIMRQAGYDIKELTKSMEILYTGETYE